jgi:hypothetical protein
MTIPRLLGFAEYWTETPPANEILALVHRKDDGGSSSSGERGDPNELFQMMPKAMPHHVR